MVAQLQSAPLSLKLCWSWKHHTSSTVKRSLLFLPRVINIKRQPLASTALYLHLSLPSWRGPRPYAVYTYVLQASTKTWANKLWISVFNVVLGISTNLCFYLLFWLFWYLWPGQEWWLSRYIIPDIIHMSMFTHCSFLTFPLINCLENRNRGRGGVTSAVLMVTPPTTLTPHSPASTKKFYNQISFFAFIHSLLFASTPL